MFARAPYCLVLLLLLLGCAEKVYQKSESKAVSRSADMKSALTYESIVGPARQNQIHKQYVGRVKEVRDIRNLVAFWDFVERVDDSDVSSHFVSTHREAPKHKYELQPTNISLDYWLEGSQPTMEDYPLLGRGPFGQAVGFSDPISPTELPMLAVPRKDLHDTPLDIKGPDKSVSLIVWLLYESGSHAIAGIWHEGTVTPGGIPPKIQVPGKRQFGLFAGLAANPGGIGAHISENGSASFGDKYARNLAATPDKMRKLPPQLKMDETDDYWNCVALVYDREKGEVSAFLNGSIVEEWVDNPAGSQFYKHAHRAWTQGHLSRLPGLQPGEELDFPKAQYYSPPEEKAIASEVVSEDGSTKEILYEYPYTRVLKTFEKNADGSLGREINRDLVGIQTNPFWFGHDIYSPQTLEAGGPFTVGRVIHSNRNSSMTAWIGGVAVYDRALNIGELNQLAKIGNCVNEASKSME